MVQYPIDDPRGRALRAEVQKDLMRRKKSLPVVAYDPHLRTLPLAILLDRLEAGGRAAP